MQLKEQAKEQLMVELRVGLALNGAIDDRSDTA